ncbi:MAG: four helix bundle protein [Pyrinomonadaceae bacterium]|nr:four helix bundle protein [Pyrinomonadaceae bacterium]
MTEGNGQIRSHRDLIAWQKAMDLVVTVYTTSKTLPKEELFALTNQMRRAAVSVPANIAEGQGRRLKAEFRQFLGNARGSLLELDTHLELAFRLGYLNAEQYDGVQNQLQEVGRIINGLLRSLADDT